LASCRNHPPALKRHKFAMLIIRLSSYPVQFIDLEMTDYFVGVFFDEY
jgi:hypothetical protein